MSFLGSVEDAEGQSRQQRRIVKPGGRPQKSMVVWRVRGRRHREWLTSVLVCDDCSRGYPEDRDECPECGCLDAELVDTGGGCGRFSGYRNLRPVLAIRQVSPAVGIAAGRVLRRWYRAKRLTKQITVQRVERATGHVRYRRCRKPKQEVAWWPWTVERRVEVWFTFPFRCGLLDQPAWLKFGRAGHSDVLLDEVFE
jgi:hypothetical protein